LTTWTPNTKSVESLVSVREPLIVKIPISLEGFVGLKMYLSLLNITKGGNCYCILIGLFSSS
jgi:hypothetical protein